MINKEVQEELLQEIILQLDYNYQEDKKGIIENLIRRYILFIADITNRKIEDPKLQPYVINAVIMAYLRLGKEGSSSSSEGGMSDSFVDIEEKLKNDVRGIRLLP